MYYIETSAISHTNAPICRHFLRSRMTLASYNRSLVSNFIYASKQQPMPVQSIIHTNTCTRKPNGWLTVFLSVNFSREQVENTIFRNRREKPAFNEHPTKYYGTEYYLLCWLFECMPMLIYPPPVAQISDVIGL